MKVGRVVLLVLLLTVSTLPAADAQEAAAVEVLTDGTGDVDLEIAETPLGNPAGAFDYLDLLSAQVLEEKETITISIQAVSLDDVFQENAQTGGQLYVYFTHEDTEFRTMVGFCTLCFNNYFWGNLHSRPLEGEEWSFVTGTDMFGDLVVDMDAATVHWSIDRKQFLDQNGAAPFPGRILTDFWAESRYWTNGAQLFSIDGNPAPLPVPVAVADRMPDAGFAESELPIRFGIAQTGTARLASDIPFRASNGEATTIVYDVLAANIGTEADVFELRPDGLPTQWSISLPYTSVALEPGQNVSIPVLVNTPFAHQHGGFDSFVLEMASVSDPGSVGRVELGVHYLTIAQPAGHHDTVYFHSRVFETSNQINDVFLTAFGGGISPYMNTLQVDEADAGVAVPARSAGTNPFAAVNTGGETPYQSWFDWLIYLDPELRMGLDFDMEGTGHLILPIDFPIAGTPFSMYGQLVVLGENQCCDGQWQYPYGYREPTVLANFTDLDVDVGTGGQHTFDVEFAMEEAADLIAYDPAQSLAMHVLIEVERPQTFLVDDERPVLLPGGSLRLPLFEYQDPVDEAFQGTAAPVLAAINDAFRFANPGDTILFDVFMKDPGGAEGEYGLSLTGQNPEWGEILGPKRVALDGTPLDPITVSVKVPESSEHGDRADIFLQAVHRDDPTRRGLVRLVVDVDTQNEHPDDLEALNAIREGEAQDSPAIGVWSVLVVALFAMLRRRTV